jgi:hypothetical protein
MRNRTRRRWLRRLAVGISFAAFAAPAAAGLDEGGAGPSSAAGPSISSKAFLDGELGPRPTAVVRPDDRADRFTASQPAAASRVDASVSWDGAITLGVGTLVLVLALGLGIGYIRRPRMAGI